MIIRAIDENGDWQFGKSLQDYASNNIAVGYSIQTRLSSFLGDCWFSITDGIDWMNLLGTNNQLAINLAVSSCILNTEGVTGIQQLSISVDRNTRDVSIKYRVQTAFSVQGLAGQYQYNNLGG